MDGSMEDININFIGGMNMETIEEYIFEELMDHSHGDLIEINALTFEQLKEMNKIILNQMIDILKMELSKRGK